MKSPDAAYLKSREDLLDFEDARFNSLVERVANYFMIKNQHSVWGSFLQTIAQELARLDYHYAYRLVGKSPSYLTPADIKRRWVDPLFVNRTYPTVTQYDLEFKRMVQMLLKAYRQGAKTSALEAVIFAYTGESITVQELFKDIGAHYDQSDRNSISVSVSVGDTLSLDDSYELNKLRVVTQDLYGAIDLGKPAHVGLNLTAVFGMGESIYEDVIIPMEDDLRLFVYLVEQPPQDPMLTQAPLLDPKSPDTRLAPSDRFGLVSPRIDKAWEVRDDVVQITDLD